MKSASLKKGFLSKLFIFNTLIGLAASYSHAEPLFLGTIILNGGSSSVPVDFNGTHEFLGGGGTGAGVNCNSCHAVDGVSVTPVGGPSIPAFSPFVFQYNPYNTTIHKIQYYGNDKSKLATKFKFNQTVVNEVNTFLRDTKNPNKMVKVPSPKANALLALTHKWRAEPGSNWLKTPLAQYASSFRVPKIPDELHLLKAIPQNIMPGLADLSYISSVGIGNGVFVMSNNNLQTFSNIMDQYRDPDYEPKNERVLGESMLVQIEDSSTIPYSATATIINATEINNRGVLMHEGVHGGLQKAEALRTILLDWAQYHMERTDFSANSRLALERLGQELQLVDIALEKIDSLKLPTLSVPGFGKVKPKRTEYLEGDELLAQAMPLIALAAIRLELGANAADRQKFTSLSTKFGNEMLWAYNIPLKGNAVTGKLLAGALIVKLMKDQALIDSLGIIADFLDYRLDGRYPSKAAAPFRGISKTELNNFFKRKGAIKW